jgi:hypothetical protein
MLDSMDGTPNIFVPLALFGWIPAVVFLFLLLPYRRAVVAAFLLAWMFLPMYGYELSGLPDYTKSTAICVGVFLASFIFAAPKLFSFRPAWFDLPILALCLVPLASSLMTGRGPYDGASGVFKALVQWGMPYYIGRTLLRDHQGVRDLAWGIFIGGLVYVPLCWFEMRFSPQLHNIVYGFHQHMFLQSWRGGWRPIVFMQHGLMVSMFLASATLMGWWFWRSKAARVVWGVPIWLPVGVLAITTLMSRSAGAMALLVMGFAALTVTKWLRLKVVVYAMMLVPVAYMLARTVGGWDARELVDLAATLFGSDRAQSLFTRLRSETMLWDIVQARRATVFGLAWFDIVGWQSADGAAEGDLGVIPDGLWIILLGVNGLIGLGSFALVLTLPVFLTLKRFPVRMWATPQVGPGIILAIGLAVYFIDCLFNAMINPLFILAAGALSSASRDRSILAPDSETIVQPEIIEEPQHDQPPAPLEVPAWPAR